uniref:Transmembrane protein n=1 Tax=Heterorhabditis bacteriophora TaxID=37862 RepID=A0A1I7WVS1_HETBA
MVKNHIGFFETLGHDKNVFVHFIHYSNYFLFMPCSFRVLWKLFPWRRELNVFSDNWPLNENKFLPGKSFETKRFINILVRAKDGGSVIRENVLKEIQILNQWITNNISIPTVDGNFNLTYQDTPVYLGTILGNSFYILDGLDENAERFAPNFIVSFSTLSVYALVCSFCFKQRPQRGIDWIRSKPWLACAGAALWFNYRDFLLQLDIQCHFKVTVRSINITDLNNCQKIKTAYPVNFRQFQRTKSTATTPDFSDSSSTGSSDNSYISQKPIKPASNISKGVSPPLYQPVIVLQNHHHKEPSQIVKWLGETYGPFLLSNPVRLVAAGIFVLYIIGACYGQIL